MKHRTVQWINHATEDIPEPRRTEIRAKMNRWHNEGDLRGDISTRLVKEYPEYHFKNWQNGPVFKDLYL